MVTKKDDTTASTKSSKQDSRQYFYAAGKRKTSIAKVRLYPKGKGNIEVNGKKVEEYFFGTLVEKVLQPLKILGVTGDYDIVAEVYGGGMSSQASAVCHGISKALALTDESVRTTVKRAGLLTRDARVKERKKYGLKRARRAPQWSKR